MANPYAPTPYRPSVTAKKGAEVAGAGGIGLILAQTVIIPGLSQFEWYDHTWDEALTGIIALAVAAAYRAYDNWRKNG